MIGSFQSIQSTMKTELPVNNPIKSFWLTAEDEFATYRTKGELPQETDIIIIGSGYAGSTLAYYLYENDKTAKKSILMLEARNVCSGATARNGGHLKPDLYSQYKYFKSKYGEKGAAEIINFEHSHLKAVKEVVEKEKIDCDFVLTRACDVHLSSQSGKSSIENYYEMIKNPYVTCKDDVQITFGEAAKVISKVEDSSVCLTYTAGQLWPYKLMTALLKKVVSKGLNLQTNTPVLKVDRLENGKYLVETSRGKIITEKVIYATNGYTAAIEPKFENKIVPIKGACSHIISSDPKIRTPHLTNTYGIRYKGADTDYLINRPDGSVIVGGAKKHIFPFKEVFYNNVDDSTLIEGTKEYFDDYMKKMFYTWKDFKATTDYVWSGILGYSDDTVPYVGEMLEEKNKFVIAGFHGHGMPRVLLSAKALAKLINGNSDSLDIPSAFKITKDRMENTKNNLLEMLGTIPKSKL